MWTLLFLMACSDPPVRALTPEGASAKIALAQALESRQPTVVQAKAKHAAQWEGQDQALDHLLGDALANVLMHPKDGLNLLNAQPKPDDPDWTRAMLMATFRTGDVPAMKRAWATAGRQAIPFDNPITPSIVQRALASPDFGLKTLEAGIKGCALLDAQPPIGRKALEYPASASLLKVAAWLGADATVIGRPKAVGDGDPQLARGPLQCERKVLVDDWPQSFTKTLTLGLKQGNRKVFIDIKITDGEPWVFATSDTVAGGRWMAAAALADTPDAEQRIGALYPDGLWAKTGWAQ
jgi:hypothetical protein